MMGLATKRGLAAWKRAMQPPKAPGQPGRPPKPGTLAWLRRKQLSLL